MKRIAKLLLGYLIILIGFAVATVAMVFPEIISYPIAAIMFCILLYIPSFVVAADVPGNISVSKKSIWVTAILCMPILAIPMYIVFHSENDS